MESQFRPGLDGTYSGPASRGYTGTPPPPPPYATPSRSMQISGFVLRALAVVLTFIASIVMGTAKQTKSLNVGGGFVDFTVKSGKSSALVYFIVINVLAFLYSAFSLAISLLKRANSKYLELPLSIADLHIAVLLFSANSAAAGLSIIAEDGNSNLLWGQICDTMNTFCAQMNASIVLSMFASLAYFLLVLLAIFGFYRRSF